MGLLRLFLYDQPMSMRRFVLEFGAMVILIALIAGYIVAKILTSPQ